MDTFAGLERYRRISTEWVSSLRSVVILSCLSDDRSQSIRWKTESMVNRSASVRSDAYRDRNGLVEREMVAKGWKKRGVCNSWS